MHAHFGTAVHPGVGHVVARIAAEDDLDLVERLADVLLNGQKVRENLRGMVNVGQPVPNGNTRVRGQCLHHGLFKAAVLDAVVVATEHDRRILPALLLAHVAHRGGEIGDVSALILGGNLKRTAGAGGGLFKQQRNVLVFERLVLDAGTLFVLQICSELEQVGNFIGGEILQREK